MADGTFSQELLALQNSEDVIRPIDIGSLFGNIVGTTVIDSKHRESSSRIAPHSRTNLASPVVRVSGGTEVSWPELLPCSPAEPRKPPVPAKSAELRCSALDCAKVLSGVGYKCKRCENVFVCESCWEAGLHPHDMDEVPLAPDAALSGPVRDWLLRNRQSSGIKQPKGSGTSKGMYDSASNLLSGPLLQSVHDTSVVSGSGSAPAAAGAAASSQPPRASFSSTLDRLAVPSIASASSAAPPIGTPKVAPLARVGSTNDPGVSSYVMGGERSLGGSNRGSIADAPLSPASGADDEIVALPKDCTAEEAKAAESLLQFLEKGWITAEQYKDRIQSIADGCNSRKIGELIDKAKHCSIPALHVVEGIPGPAVLNAVRCLKYVYDVESDSWRKHAVLALFHPGRAFQEGNMRWAYLMKDLTRNYGREDYVAKIPKVPGADPAELFTVFAVDVQMQALCKYLADRFNERRPPKSVRFIDAGIVELLDQIPSLGGNKLFAVEEYLPGRYEKHNTNWGFVSSVQRNTPQAFSHFTHHYTKGGLLVCDIQGVGDIYTDPQIHTKNGDGFGKGNMGVRGIDRFFKSHHCNNICRQLGIYRENPDFARSAFATDMGTIAASSRAALEYDVNNYDLEKLRISAADFERIAAAFRKTDYMSKGSILKRDVVQLCADIGIQIESAEDIEDLAQAMDRFDTGDITFKEFVLFWCGVEE